MSPGVVETEGPPPAARAARTAAPERAARPVRWWWVAGLVAIALLLRAPVLRMGFYLDDYVLRLVLERPDLLPTIPPWNVYDFGTEADWGTIAGEDATIPWWIGEGWRIRFFRPLTSLSLRIDDTLFGTAAAGWHAVGLALLAAMLVAAHALHRALGLAPREALLALGLLAASGASVVPAGWIANRNSLLAVLCTQLAVLTLARAPRPARPRALVAAGTWALLACLAKEEGVAAFPLLAAFLVLDPRRPRGQGDVGDPGERAARRRAALVLLLPALAWLAALAALGYGTESLFYATPWREPGRFLAGVAANGLAGATSLATPFVLDLAFLQPALLAPAMASGALLVVLCALGLRAVARGRRDVLFLAAWSVLLLLPQGAAPPADRLLLGSSVGVAGLLGVLIAAGLARRGLARVGAWSLLVLAGPLSAAATLGLSVSLVTMADEVRAAVLDADVGPPELGRREAFVLQAESAAVPFALPATWMLESGDLDVRFWILHMGRRAVRWTGIDERTFELAFDEPLLDAPFERVYRTREAPIAVGRRWRVARFEVEALAVEDGLPTVLRVRFEEPPREERHRFLVWREGTCTRLVPPAPGETIELPRIVPPNPFVP